MSWLFWLIVGFAIEWAIEMWYWRGQRASRFTAPLEARVRELEEEVRRASLVGAAGRAPTTSSRAGAGAAAPAKAASGGAASSGEASGGVVSPPIDAPTPAADVPVVTSRRSPRRDDLKVIKGIGEVFEEKLFEAGITTYGALAGTSAEEIAAIIQPADWQNYDFYDWIRQASELAQKV